MSKSAKIKAIEELLTQQDQPPRLIGNVRIEDGTFVYDLQLAQPELPDDLIVEVCETREDVEYFERHRETIRQEIEKWRELRLFERMTGGKHELADLDL